MIKKYLLFLFFGISLFGSNFNFPNTNSYKFREVFKEKGIYKKNDNNIKWVSQKGRILYKYPLEIKGCLDDNYISNKKDIDFYVLYLPEGRYSFDIYYNPKLNLFVGLYNENYKMIDLETDGDDEVSSDIRGINKMHFDYNMNYNGFIFLGLTDGDTDLFKKACYNIIIYLIKKAPAKIKTANSLPKGPYVQGYLRKKLNEIMIKRFNRKEKEIFEKYKYLKTTQPITEPDIIN